MALESLHLSTVLVPVAILALLFFIIRQYLQVQRDEREPPFIQPAIPLVGHILGIIRNGSDYYYQVDQRSPSRLYTLPILKGRLYMATTPDWAVAIHRAHKTLQFNTLIAKAITSLFLFDQETVDLIDRNLNGEDGTRGGIMLEIHDMMLNTLAPGPHLDSLNRSILNNIAPDINGLATAGPQHIKLWAWLRHHFSIASTTAIWGPKNPFAIDPSVEQAFWDFEASAMPLSMMPYPQLFARKGYLAREKTFKAFTRYMDEERYNDPEVSELIKNRVKINIGKYGMSNKMYAHGEVTLVFGALANSIPLAFWLVSRIFEDKDLLVDVRAEIDECVSTSQDDPAKRLMDIAGLRSRCPLFFSTLRETLRHVAAVNSSRYVAEDTTVTNHITDETYLLKKDSVVTIASNVIHRRPLWGDDVDSFNPRRFMGVSEKAKNEVGSNKPPDPAAPFRDSAGKLHSSAFRSFGGGNNVCPGRYFAQTEIMGLASLFIAGFEIADAARPDRGYISPPYESFLMSMGVIKPGRDVDVVLKRRQGYEDVRWEFTS